MASTSFNPEISHASFLQSAGIQQTEEEFRAKFDTILNFTNQFWEMEGPKDSSLKQLYRMQVATIQKSLMTYATDHDTDRLYQVAALLQQLYYEICEYSKEGEYVFGTHLSIAQPPSVEEFKKIVDAIDFIGSLEFIDYQPTEFEKFMAQSFSEKFLHLATEMSSFLTSKQKYFDENREAYKRCNYPGHIPGISSNPCVYAWRDYNQTKTLSYNISFNTPELIQQYLVEFKGDLDTINQMIKIVTNLSRGNEAPIEFLEKLNGVKEEMERCIAGANRSWCSIQ